MGASGAQGPPPGTFHDLFPSPSQPHMPLLSIYSLALEQDLEFGTNLVQAVSTLQTQTFVQVGAHEMYADPDIHPGGGFYRKGVQGVGKLDPFSWPFFCSP